jgi:hypothetical protein
LAKFFEKKKFYSLEGDFRCIPKKLAISVPCLFFGTLESLKNGILGLSKDRLKTV